jgi:putative transposase
MRRYPAQWLPQHWRRQSRYLRELIDDINRELPEQWWFKYPHDSVLRRRIDKALTFNNLARKTTGSEAWRKMHGHRQHISAKHPLELGIMDSTPLPCFVVDPLWISVWPLHR